VLFDGFRRRAFTEQGVGWANFSFQDCKRTFPKALNLGGAFDAVRRLLQGRGKQTSFWPEG
jgi:hypothetical protein